MSRWNNNFEYRLPNTTPPRYQISCAPERMGIDKNVQSELHPEILHNLYVNRHGRTINDTILHRLRMAFLAATATLNPNVKMLCGQLWRSSLRSLTESAVMARYCSKNIESFSIKQSMSVYIYVMRWNVMHTTQIWHIKQLRQNEPMFEQIDIKIYKLSTLSWVNRVNSTDRQRDHMQNSVLSQIHGNFRHWQWNQTFLKAFKSTIRINSSTAVQHRGISEQTQSVTISNKFRVLVSHNIHDGTI